jgi:hypothetical protein
MGVGWAVTERFFVFATPDSRTVLSAPFGVTDMEAAVARVFRAPMRSLLF